MHEKNLILIRRILLLLFFNTSFSCFNLENTDFNGLRVNCTGEIDSYIYKNSSSLGESHISEVLIKNGVLQQPLECKGLFRVILNEKITIFADGNFIQIYLNRQLENKYVYDKKSDIVKIYSINAFFPYSIILEKSSTEKIQLLFQPSLYKRVKLSIFFYPSIALAVVLCFGCIYFTCKYTAKTDYYTYNS